MRLWYVYNALSEAIYPPFDIHRMSRVALCYAKINLSITKCQNKVNMFKNKSTDGKNNLCGERVARARKAVQPKMSQRMLADALQLAGLDVDKNAIQRI